MVDYECTQHDWLIDYLKQNMTVELDLDKYGNSSTQNCLLGSLKIKIKDKIICKDNVRVRL